MKRGTRSAPTRRALMLSGAGLGLLGLTAGCLGAVAGSREEATSAGSAASAGSGDRATGGGDNGRESTVAVQQADTVAVEPVATGFASPVGFETPAGLDRQFVVDQPGVVYDVVDGEASEFLDIADRVDAGGEKGLLGVAFHPAFAENGRLFVRYSAESRPGTPDDFSHTFVLAEFTADPAADDVDPDTERTILEIPQPQRNHNAGSVVFGPDGMLYVGVGDGGSGGDRGNGHVEDWYDDVGGGNGQDVTENLLGSVLRLDVDADGDGPYAVPPDNPLVGREGLDEQYAWGFRNPWRMSFWGERLVVADVGQNEWEEVSVVESGGNYGWNVREGRHCFDEDDCPTETPAGEPLIDPVLEYPHSGADVSGISVIGGYVLPDDAPVTALAGRYVFADYVSRGRLFVADPVGETWDTAAVEVDGDDDFGRFVLAFGFDGTDLYVCTTDGRGVSGSSGAVHRVVAGDE